MSLKNVKPLFKFFPIGSIISKTNLSPIGLFPPYLPIDIPTIPIKVIATTPVAITLKLTLFLFLLLFTIPDVLISAASSGGVFSKVDFIASTIEFIGSFNASLTSAELISIVLGNPDIKSLPLICMFCS